jgi:hypothetical protein
MGKPVHVTPRPNGFAVITAGAQRASVIKPTQAQAIAVARPQAARNGSELVIHRPNGQIRAKDSHGHDPRSIKG